MSKPTKGKTEIAQVGTISPTRRDDRQHDRRGDGEGRKEGVITVEEAKSMETTLDVSRYAVRPRLPVALLRHRRQAHGAVLETA